MHLPLLLRLQLDKAFPDQSIFFQNDTQVVLDFSVNSKCFWKYLKILEKN